jgi:hypothetical protein
MIRRIIALFSFLSLLAIVAFADNQEIEINLSPSNGYQDTAMLSIGMIYVRATPDSNNDKARVSIQVLNRTGDRGLLLFNRNHTEEKETKKGDFKKNHFEIAWPDVLKTTGIRGTNGLQPDMFFIAQGHTKELPLQIPEFGNETKTLNLCFYPCLVEKKNKDGLPQKARISAEEKFSIKINVELGPDTEFEELKARCEAFVKEINKKTFCPHQKHKPDIQGQVDELEKKRETIIRDIRNFASNRSIMGATISDSKYGKLITDISQAYSAKMEDFNSEHPTCIKDCGGHPNPKKCDWCKGPKHGKGTCETHGKPIGCPKGCPKNHPKDPPLPWKEANKQLDKVLQALYGKKPISCKEAQKRAKSIWSKAQKSPDDGFKAPAKNKYDSIMKCK